MAPISVITFTETNVSLPFKLKICSMHVGRLFLLFV